ncbi:hypothetical protein SAMN05660691_00613 [Rheinheimera pacifica]|uniref:PRTase-CE domain-containing protein n=1 Tax=Rheinheimera pacifica TaxID=173990 RepID=A0A1H6JRE3_9GAMM|nr:hypothetical protein [Rheinheimera pacifica]SEH64724.1 hypothetical protein SAMN05660691_00613 [Rheinheimera pacifica]
MFEAPTDWESYYDDITNKCEFYIKSGYWEDIDKYQLKSWLENFKTDEEKYFSVCILDSLVFRTKRMIDASINEIASSKIPKFLYEIGHPLNQCIESWLTSLSTGQNVPVRFISIESVDKKTGKSGPVVIRQLKQTLDLAGHLSLKIDQIPNMPATVKAIVIVDDFSGTGEQFVGFYQKQLKNILPDGVKVLFIPLAAHVEALAHIQQQLPEVKVSPVELLTLEDSFFYPINGYFRGDKTNTVDSAIAFYKKLCSNKGFGKENYLFGKGEQGLCFAFYLSTPNNNLKILYHRKNGLEWDNLLYRNK